MIKMEPMEWVRGPMIGRGSFATVNLVTPTKFSSQFSTPIVAKSSEVSCSESLRTEKKTLSDLGDCPEIIRFLGDGFSSERGKGLYNLFFEYAKKGSLEDQLSNFGGKFDECVVKTYAKSILKGLAFMHDKGYAHCDIKLQNILVFKNGAVKIADFGLSTKIKEKDRWHQLRGTPLYMSPELVARGEAGSPADIWALGCCVVQMVSGKPAWDVAPECDPRALICRIGIGKESPEVPESLCSQGRDFISKCFIKDPNLRWTARVLLEHPFLSGSDDGKGQLRSVSPRDPFEFSMLEDDEDEAYLESARCSAKSQAEPSQLHSISIPDSFDIPGSKFMESADMDPVEFGWGLESLNDRGTLFDNLGHWSSICNRLGELASDAVPDWSDNGWVDVR